MFESKSQRRISVQFRAALLLSVPANSDAEAIHLARNVLSTSPNDSVQPINLRNPFTRAFGCLGAVAGPLHDRSGALVVEGVLQDSPDCDGNRAVINGARCGARLTRRMQVVTGYQGPTTSGALQSLLARCSVFAKDAPTETDRQNNLILARYLEAAAKAAARLEQSLDPGPHCGAVA